MPNLGPEDANIKTVESEDGVSYEVLEVPSNVTLPVVNYSGESDLEEIDAFPVHHLYVRCEALKRTRLPLDANPRRPRNSKQVGEMQDTLQHNPEDFVKKNNGLTILCDNIVSEELDDDSIAEETAITFEFDEGEGVCNGGHTYFAILTSQFEVSENAAVHIEVIEIPDSLQGAERKSELAGISRARNNNNKLEQRSEADFRGYYDPFKSAMEDSSMVSWREGDTDANFDAIGAEHFIRLMKTMDPDEFYHPLYCQRCDSHKTAATRVQSIHNSWYDSVENARRNGTDDPLTHLLPLIDDFLHLRDALSYSLENDELIDRSGDSSDIVRQTALWKNWVDGNSRTLRMGDYAGEEGLNLPKPFEVMLLGLFRTDIKMVPSADGSRQLIGWFVKPQTLWDDQKVDLLLRLNDYFKEADTDPNQFKRRVPPFERNLFTLGTGQDPPDPEILYRVSDQTKFVKSEDEDFTHWLDEESGRGMVENEEEEAPRSAPVYNIQLS
ncbi:AIPR family protein [Halorubrum sp. 2020YC2]|uniref:AIPR family protein n=1 Tax=Halorubrum sp. 2020YC2 TaxID=2836432 RepID=UPI001BE676D2|nr:AIPR family protein [Halorubrum sp. 2020YC2]QWC18984.1 AIPR family protein [Halorubrum sp. 2020YC2]